jgi:hypothetical protein
MPPLPLSTLTSTSTIPTPTTQFDPSAAPLYISIVGFIGLLIVPTVVSSFSLLFFLAAAFPGRCRRAYWIKYLLIKLGDTRFAVDDPEYEAGLGMGDLIELQDWFRGEEFRNKGWEEQVNGYFDEDGVGIVRWRQTTLM